MYVCVSLWEKGDHDGCLSFVYGLGVFSFITGYGMDESTLLLTFAYSSPPF